jgi:tetratricopeptide (TPR) repeat protein
MRYSSHLKTAAALGLMFTFSIELAFGQGRPGGAGGPPGDPDESSDEDLPVASVLSGKVVVEDGTRPPDRVVIERDCGSGSKPVANTDTKGRFSIPLGQDKSAPCEFRAVLPGYRSDVVKLSAGKTDMGTIVLHRLSNVEGSIVSVTSRDAPNEAIKAYTKGVESMKKRKWQEAQKELEKAVGLYPKYAAAWYELGMAFASQNNLEQARKALAQSLEADSKFLKPYVPSANVAMQQGNWKEVNEITERLFRLDPVDYPMAYFLNSVANLNLGDLNAAEKSAREAVKLDTGHQLPRAEHVLGVILYNKRDYAGALQLMKSYLGRVPNASDAGAIKSQIVELEKLAVAQR